MRTLLRKLSGEGKVSQIVIAVIVAVISLSLTGVVVTATNDAVTALGTTYSSAANIVKLVPLVYVAGVLFVAGFFIWMKARGEK